MSESTAEIILKARNDLAPGLNAGRKAVEQFAEGTIGHFSRLSNAVFNLRNLIAGVAAGGVAKMVFTPVIEKEQALLALQTVLGSAEAASQRLAELDEAHFGFAFDDTELAAASAQLERMGATALATGPGLRLVAGAAVATGQPIAAMAGQLGFLRSQMDAGSETFSRSAMMLQRQGVLSAAAGVQLRKLADAGAPAAEMWRVIEGDLARFDGTLERFAGSTQGKLNQVSERWEDVRKKVGEAALPALTRALDALAAELERLSASGQLQEFAEDAGKALKTLYETVARVSRFLLEHREAVRLAAEAYIAFRVISATTESVLALTRNLAALSAAQVAAAGAAKANAAAQASVGAAAATAAGPAGLGLLKTGLLAIGPQLVMAGVAGIVAEILEIKRAVQDANDEILKIPDLHGSGAKRTNAWWEIAKNVKDSTFGGVLVKRLLRDEEPGEHHDEGPDEEPEGPWLETDPVTRAQRAQQRKKLVDEGKLPPPPTAPPPEDAGKVTEKQAKEAAALMAEAEAEFNRRRDVRQTLDKKEAALSRETVRTTAEREEWERAARERQFRESSDDYLAALWDYARRAWKAQQEVAAAQTEIERDAAQAKLASAQRLASAEAEALGIRIDALRNSAETYESAAQSAQQKEAAALALALDPQAAQRAAQDAEQEKRATQREQARLERRVKALRDRDMQRDDQGVWRDHFGVAANQAGQLALNWDEQRTKGREATAKASEARDEAARAQTALAAVQGRLQAATVDLGGKTAGLRDEIAALRKDLAQPGNTGIGRLTDEELTNLLVNAAGVVDNYSTAEADNRRRAIAQMVTPPSQLECETPSSSPALERETPSSSPAMLLPAVPNLMLPQLPPTPPVTLDVGAMVKEQQRANSLLAKLTQMTGVE